MRAPTLSVIALAIGCRSTDKLPDEEPIEDTAGLSVDADGDGYDAAEDCDDNNSLIHPGAEELCDGADNNCDGQIDEDVLTTYYADTDGDGFGDNKQASEACEAPAGSVPNGNDCDDADPDTYPAAAERCDGVDNDCDGDVDEDVQDTFYADADADGFGDPAAPLDDCDPPEGYTGDGTDCDDTDPDSFPGGVEVCDEADNDCDGSVDEGVTTTYYQDTDGDRYGLSDVTTEACDLPTGYADAPGDCDDSDGSISPGAAEVCNEVDDDCDGQVDEGVQTTYYADADSDGYGDASDTADACAAPSGYVSDSTDCDDAEAAANPGEAEVCDEIDNDCDGTVDEGVTTTYYADDDSDGFGDAGDTTEACSLPSGYASDDTDCDDGDAAISPDGEEVCDSADNDCDGTIDEDDATDAEAWYADSDGDGYGDSRYSTVACAEPSGYAGDDTDCDDTDAGINPGEAEVCDGIDQDCDGSADEDFDDADSDGVADCVDVCPVYADPTVTSGDGAITSPYPSIADAISLRGGYCDEIVLMPGTYDENVDYGGEDLQISSYSGADYTIISPTAGGSVVTIASGETSAASLSGVTLSGGTGTVGDGATLASGYTHGGGLYVVSADPSITDCVIEDNSVGGFGGGALLYDYDGAFTGNLVDSNSSTSSSDAGGGGVFLNGDAEFVGNTVVDNTKTGTSGDGGGLMVYGAPLIEGNWFEGNTASSSGGGIRSANASAMIFNNVFYDNSPSGLTLSYDDDGPVMNNTFIDNASYGINSFTCCGYTGTTGPTSEVVNNIIDGSGRYGIYVTGLTTFAALTHNNVYGSGTADYAGLSDPTGSSGNISQDPLFTSSTDFSLRASSPCVDAGTDTSSGGVSEDIDGTSRYLGSGYDMGAYESH